METVISFVQTNWTFFAPFIGASLVAMLISESEINWFNTLKRPFYDPPFAVWMIACNLLYFVYGKAFQLIWLDTSVSESEYFLPGISCAIGALILNYAWTPLTFKYKNLYAALVVSLLSVFEAALAGFCFYQMQETAGLLIVPYVAWYLFATWISYCFYRDNKSPASPIKGSPRNSKKSE